MDLITTDFFPGFSKNTRIDYYKYKGVNLHEQVIIPHFWGNSTTSCVILDLQFPIGQYDCLMDGLYCSEGYGVPVFNSLDDARHFIDSIT